MKINFPNLGVAECRIFSTAYSAIGMMRDRPRSYAIDDALKVIEESEEMTLTIMDADIKINRILYTHLYIKVKKFVHCGTVYVIYDGYRDGGGWSSMTDAAKESLGRTYSPAILEMYKQCMKKLRIAEKGIYLDAVEEERDNILEKLKEITECVQKNREEIVPCTGK